MAQPWWSPDLSTPTLAKPHFSYSQHAIATRRGLDPGRQHSLATFTCGLASALTSLLNDTGCSQGGLLVVDWGAPPVLRCVVRGAHGWGTRGGQRSIMMFTGKYINVCRYGTRCGPVHSYEWALFACPAPGHRLLFTAAIAALTSAPHTCVCFSLWGVGCVRCVCVRGWHHCLLAFKAATYQQHARHAHCLFVG